MIGDCEHEWRPSEESDEPLGRYQCINCSILSNLTGEKYAEFLQSKQWKELRNERLVIDDFGCQDCGDMATEVHHLDYSNVLDTNKMVSLCKECHIERHIDENYIHCKCTEIIYLKNKKNRPEEHLKCPGCGRGG